jgi:hypothetical protein
VACPRLQEAPASPLEGVAIHRRHCSFAVG